MRRLLPGPAQAVDLDEAYAVPPSPDRPDRPNPERIERRLAAGMAPVPPIAVVSGPLPGRAVPDGVSGLELRHVLESDGFLFLRYAVR